VIPFVFHHGETGLKRGVRFIEEFSFHPDERTLFERYIPDFDIEEFWDGIVELSGIAFQNEKGLPNCRSCYSIYFGSQRWILRV
jgi:hypothetical protein